MRHWVIEIKVVLYFKVVYFNLKLSKKNLKRLLFTLIFTQIKLIQIVGLLLLQSHKYSINYLLKNYNHLILKINNTFIIFFLIIKFKKIIE